MSQALTKEFLELAAAQQSLQDMADTTTGANVMSGGMGAGLGGLGSLLMPGAQNSLNQNVGFYPAPQSPLPIIAGNSSIWITHGGVTGTIWQHHQRLAIQQQNALQNSPHHSSLNQQQGVYNVVYYGNPNQMAGVGTVTVIGGGTGGTSALSVAGTSIPNTSYTTAAGTYYNNAGVIGMYPPSTPAPTSREWFFDWVRIAEDYAISAKVPYRHYDDRVFDLLDRRKFNHKEIDLAALAAFCLCNDVDLKSFLEAAPEYYGLEFV